MKILDFGKFSRPPSLIFGKFWENLITMFYLKKILSKKIPAERRRGRSLSDQESPRKTMGAEDVRGRSAEDVFIKKNSRLLAEHARGTCHGRLPRKVTQIKNPRRKQLARKTPAYDFAEDSCGRRPRKIRGRQPRKTIKKNFF